MGIAAVKMAETRSLIQKLTYEVGVDCIPFGKHLSLHTECTVLLCAVPLGSQRLILAAQLHDHKCSYTSSFWTVLYNLSVKH